MLQHIKSSPYLPTYNPKIILFRSSICGQQKHPVAMYKLDLDPKHHHQNEQINVQ